jgi:hypothetical protein
MLVTWQIASSLPPSPVKISAFLGDQGFEGCVLVSLSDECTISNLFNQVQQCIDSLFEGNPVVTRYFSRYRLLFTVYSPASINARLDRRQLT